jgi:uncharacterized membrane protein YeaQ/YmgE (transglycosylase-associated protein family)
VNLFLTIIVGGIIGFVASRVMKTDEQMAIFANIIIGIVGAFAGNLIGGMMGIGSGMLMGLIVAIAGAAGLIAVLKRTGVLERLPV